MLPQRESPIFVYKTKSKVNHFSVLMFGFYKGDEKIKGFKLNVSKHFPNSMCSSWPTERYNKNSSSVRFHMYVNEDKIFIYIKFAH
jgi:hypothetical protein